MIITTTAIGFILLSLGLALYGLRFLKALRVDAPPNDRTGFLISLYFLGFAFQNGVIGFGTLFLASSPEGLFFVSILADSFLTLVAIFGIYIIYYILIPKESPWFAMVFTFILGLIEVSLDIILHVQPFVTSAKGIDWNAPFLPSLILFYLLLISIGASLYIFMRLFFQAKSKEIKVLSLVLAIAAAGGITDGFVGFVLAPLIKINDITTGIYDVGIGIISIFFIVTFLYFSISGKKGK
jgi:hypothetical protein